MHTTCKDKRHLEKFFSSLNTEKCFRSFDSEVSHNHRRWACVPLSHVLWFYNNFQAISVPSTVLPQDMANFYLAQYYVALNFAPFSLKLHQISITDVTVKVEL